MNAMTGFDALVTGARGRKSNYKDSIKGILPSHSMVPGILTLCRAKTPGIPTKKNKKSSADENQVILSISGSKGTKIAYIAVKKIKKCLTFDYRCARNKLL